MPALDEAASGAVAAAFLGESMQVPPMYSALKHEGQRLYRLARAGVEVERAPRRVCIERLELLAARCDWLDFEVACSKGTYVRSLAEDIARASRHGRPRRKLCGALGLGPFNGMAMHTLDRIEEAASRAGLETTAACRWMRRCRDCPPSSSARAEQASRPAGPGGPSPGPGASPECAYTVLEGRFLGVGRMSAEGARLSPERIMVEVPESPASRA